MSAADVRAAEAYAAASSRAAVEPRRLRVVFMGTPAYALGSLRALTAADFVDIACVVTRPDAVSGRGKKLIPSPVKQLAQELGLPILETKSLRGQEVIDQLRALEPDVIAVTAFGAIVPDELIELPALGCFNVHASILPAWRGAAPMQRALLAGDARVGYSVMRIEHGLDTGAWCSQGSVEVGERCYPEISAELSAMGGAALVEALATLARGEELAWVEQDDALATLAPKIDKSELRLDPDQPAAVNMRRVQASSDEAPSRARVAGRDVRVLRAHVVAPGEEAPRPARGLVSAAGGRLVLGCADGSALEVLEIKPDGKRAMAAREFLAGVRQSDGLDWRVIA